MDCRSLRAVARSALRPRPGAPAARRTLPRAPPAPPTNSRRTPVRIAAQQRRFARRRLPQDRGRATSAQSVRQLARCPVPDAPRPPLRAPPAPPTNSRRTPVHTAAPPGPTSDGRAGRLRRADPGRRSYRQIAAAWPASGPGPHGRPTDAAAAWSHGCRGGNPPEVPGAARIRPRRCARRSADRLPSSALPCGPLTRRQLTGSRRGRSDVQAIERDGGHLQRRVFTDDDRASRCTRAPERAQNMPSRTTPG